LPQHEKLDLDLANVFRVWDNNRTMSNDDNKATPISELLRRTILEAVESGRTNYKALQRETGVTRASIQRFVDGRTYLRLDMADRLAAFFNLELKHKRKGR
jgi:plasmid maintenance system antidote protein VapI